MSKYQYKVIPAPTKGTKAKGIKTVEGRFALSVEAVLNQMGADGWEYLRAELLPSDERSGLTGSTTNWRNVLVFRRPTNDDTPAPRIEHTPIAVPVIQPVTQPVTQEAPPLTAGAKQMLKDNGVEETSDVAGMTTSLRTRAAQQKEDPKNQGSPDDASATLDGQDDTPKDDVNKGFPPLA
ncbi:MAG: hypothetical protein ACI92Z_001788 [Paracoccaceae bacterium]|jgi:hypothetical protein